MAVAVPPTGLPVEACIAELKIALEMAGHAVLRAPPGAGKTTVVPLRLLDEGWLAGRRIVILEPRRLATRAAARRMAALIGEEVGVTVGYRTRDERRVGRATRIEVVTEGILTRRVQHDPSLPGVGLVIFDEFHERNLQADLALALVLDARSALCPDLRLLAMSATLETTRVAAMLGGASTPAPMISSEGRAHPVEVRWTPPPPRQRLVEGVAATVRQALGEEHGDLLVFLPGAGEIRRVAAALTSGELPAHIDLRPLFGALTPAAQDTALAPSAVGRRRVVLATDIAETSLTVEGVRVVVDGGQARAPRYDPRSGLTRLHTGPASRASAEQRAGRAGRTEPGVAYRMWSSADHATRRAFADPEILSVDLAGFALEIAVWGAAADELSFLDRPPARVLHEAAGLLRQLGAVDDDGRPTSAGREMVDLPLHPRLARMVTESVPAGKGPIACALAALLEDRDLLRGPPDGLPVDVTSRLSLITDRDARHPLADRSAVQATRRRTGELTRRVGIPMSVVNPADCGPVLALAYPDRVAQSRGHGRFRLRSGGGAWIATADPLAAEPFLVIAELDADHGDNRIRLAAALDPADVVSASGSSIEVATTLSWDEGRDELRAHVEQRLGGLVLSATEGPAEPGPATTEALLHRVRATHLGALRWTEATRALQQRVSFAARYLGDDWPDISDSALLATVDQWLRPRLNEATGRDGLLSVDLGRALRGFLGHKRMAQLDELVPQTILMTGGHRVSVDYGEARPIVDIRVQELYGTTRHPTVAGGQVPIVLRLLSPAGRPIQVTADLPGFWAGTWAVVRKEMMGRYPKHSWPLDPAIAQPVGRQPRRR